MSLINDALKKVQSGAPAAPNPPNGTGDGHHPPPSPKQLAGQAVAVVGVIILLITIAIVLILILLENKDDKKQPKQQPAPITAPAQQAAKPQPISVAKHATVETNPAPVLAIQTPAPALPVTQPTPAAATPAQEIAPAPTPLPAQKNDGPSPQILEYVQSIQIWGASAEKVLLVMPEQQEAKGYFEGDMLESMYELQLTKIGPRQIIITDTEGHKYYKNL